MGMDGWLRACAVLLIACGTAACSDDSDDSSGGGATGVDAGPVGGTGGTTGGSGGTLVGTGGTGGSTGGSGGTMPVGGMGATVMCDTSIETTATCGGRSCPPASQISAACEVPCCSANDMCGFRNAAMDAVTDCVESPPLEPNCPDYVGMVTLQGCCFDGDTCGFISTFSNSCINTSGLLADLAEQAGAACDGSDNDGGVVGDAGPADASTN